MKRVSNWPMLLAAFLEERRSTPFEYGANDCALFAADWILALTGVDPAKELRGSYRTKRQADAILAERPLRAFADALFERLPSVAFAQRGDIVLHEEPDGDSLGVCDGPSFCAPGKDGLIFQSVLTARIAWKVAR